MQTRCTRLCVKQSQKQILTIKAILCYLVFLCWQQNGFACRLRSDPDSCRAKLICVRIRKVTEGERFKFLELNWNPFFIENLYFSGPRKKVFPGCHSVQSWCPVLSSSWAPCGSTVWHKPAVERSYPGKWCCLGSESGFWRVWGWKSHLWTQCRVLAGTRHNQWRDMHLRGLLGLAAQRGSTTKPVRTRKCLKLFSSPVLVRSVVVFNLKITSKSLLFKILHS